MADIEESTTYKSLVTRIRAALSERGLDAEPVAVRNVLTHAVATLAERLDVGPRAVLLYIEPDVIADQIAAAADPAAEGSDYVHGVRPARPDARSVPTPRHACSRPLMALTQALKYASTNGDSRTVQHAADLAFELGVAVGADPDRDRVDIPVGVLDEAADILDHVADRIESHGWSLCPCGDKHGQARIDAQVLDALRGDADLVRTTRAGVDG
ncbi:hypothetical protein OG948_59860 (plasmid) [Embleya sp. NBC_00888]|uniref:hypothetical protein n=1 Tax=Embleya sp. NBC_00888 TaxID=2975960 RepID=UPI00386B2417|nr:hypothetical protein OG948_59860 [Embleya sp. NBC_00888]